MKLTEQQQTAVEHRGSNLLVAASAGSGKTEVLARRCVSLITDPENPCQVDQLLVVTFTRAAAAELRARVGKMLRAAASETRDRHLRDHLRRQEVLVDTAEIGTIDAWCAHLVREHFTASERGVDPAFNVLGAEQATLLRNEVLDELFEWIYTGDEELAVAARNWILRHSKPNDDFLRGFVLELNRYREHLINPDQWIERQLELHSRGPGELRADAARVLADALAAECGFQQEQLDALDEWVGVETTNHHIILEIVDNGQQTHTVMVHHIRTHDSAFLAQRQPGVCVVDGLVEAVGAEHLQFDEMGNILHDGPRAQVHGEQRSIGRDH